MGSISSSTSAAASDVDTVGASFRGVATLLVLSSSSSASRNNRWKYVGQRRMVAAPLRWKVLSGSADSQTSHGCLCHSSCRIENADRYSMASIASAVVTPRGGAFARLGLCEPNSCNWPTHSKAATVASHPLAAPPLSTGSIVAGGSEVRSRRAESSVSSASSSSFSFSELAPACGGCCGSVDVVQASGDSPCLPNCVTTAQNQSKVTAARWEVAPSSSTRIIAAAGALAPLVFSSAAQGSRHSAIPAINAGKPHETYSCIGATTMASDDEDEVDIIADADEELRNRANERVASSARWRPRPTPLGNGSDRDSATLRQNAAVTGKPRRQARWNAATEGASTSGTVRSLPVREREWSAGARTPTPAGCATNVRSAQAQNSSITDVVVVMREAEGTPPGAEGGESLMSEPQSSTKWVTTAGVRRLGHASSNGSTTRSHHR